MWALQPWHARPRLGGNWEHYRGALCPGLGHGCPPNFKSPDFSLQSCSALVVLVPTRRRGGGKLLLRSSPGECAVPVPPTDNQWNTSRLSSLPPAQGRIQDPACHPGRTGATRERTRLEVRPQEEKVARTGWILQTRSLSLARCKVRGSSTLWVRSVSLSVSKLVGCGVWRKQGCWL